MSSSNSAVFDRLGGSAAVSAIVAELYERIGADSELAPYFHRTDMVVQREKLAEMITQALGGPEAPWLLSLRDAHSGRGVTHRHFSMLAAHLIDILIERNVGADEIDVMMHWVSEARAEVVEDQTPVF